MISLDQRILVVDDDRAMADSVSAVLRSDGFRRVEVMTDANAAVAHINNHQYDLVLLDIMMPGMTGFQLLDAVDREQLNTAFVILTGEVSLESAVEALRRGASDYVRKPCDPDELLFRVRKVLEQQQLGAENQRIISENRALEQQLRHAQKIEAVGALAHGVAHDFNNILAIITGNSELAKLQLEATNPAREYLDKVALAGQRARELVYQLLAFSRQEDGDWQSLELNSLVAECVTLVRASIPSNVMIRQGQALEPYFVKGDATQIHQIIINLCINASHAMEDHGGELDIALERQTITENNSNLPPGQYIRLAVSDTGTGIAPEHLDKIFDPYFSTKAPNKGSGMGLAVVHGIVRNHGGEINVRSERGVGSEFEIFLPISHSDALMANDPVTGDLTSGQGRIMLVDDEEMVLEVLAKIATQLGYDVDRFDSSEAALAHFSGHRDDYDALLTDMTMPGMSGDELAAAVRQLHPTLPILLCSGLSVTLDEDSLKRTGITEFLAKPVSAQDLGAALARAVQQARKDRRRSPRYTASSPAFVIFDNRGEERGALVDVSLSGLAISINDPALPTDNPSLSIVVGDQVVDQLACRKVFARNEDSTHNAGLTCGLEFETLSSGQRHRLQSLIEKHGIPVPQ